MINEEKTLLTSNINLMFRMYREPATSIRSSCAPLIERRFIEFVFSFNNFFPPLCLTFSR